MKLYGVHPASVRDGDRLCDDRMEAFATVVGNPWIDGSSVWAETDMIRVEFPSGSTVNIER